MTIIYFVKKFNCKKSKLNFYFYSKEFCSFNVCNFFFKGNYEILCFFTLSTYAFSNNILKDNNDNFFY